MFATLVLVWSHKICTPLGKRHTIWDGKDRGATRAGVIEYGVGFKVAIYITYI